MRAMFNNYGDRPALGPLWMTALGFERYPLLRSASIYGANASGKSNLIQAFAFFRYFVRRSAENRQEGDKIPVHPFMLDPKLAKRPSEFEMTFILNGVPHEYGFVVSQQPEDQPWRCSTDLHNARYHSA